MSADAKTVHATGALMMTVSTIEGYVNREGAEVKNKTDSRRDGGVHAIVMALSPSGSLAWRRSGKPPSGKQGSFGVEG